MYVEMVLCESVASAGYERLMRPADRLRQGTLVAKSTPCVSTAVFDLLTTATRPRQRMWAGVYEFAESTGYERLVKVCKVCGGKGMFVIKIAFRAPTVKCWNISKFAVALAMNIGLQCVLRH